MECNKISELIAQLLEDEGVGCVAREVADSEGMIQRQTDYFTSRSGYLKATTIGHTRCHSKAIYHLDRVIGMQDKIMTTAHTAL